MVAVAKASRPAPEASSSLETTSEASSSGRVGQAQLPAAGCGGGAHRAREEAAAVARLAAPLADILGCW